MARPGPVRGTIASRRACDPEIQVRWARVCRSRRQKQSSHRQWSNIGEALTGGSSEEEWETPAVETMHDEGKDDNPSAAIFRAAEEVAAKSSLREWTATHVIVSSSVKASRSHLR